MSRWRGTFRLFLLGDQTSIFSGASAVGASVSWDPRSSHAERPAIIFLILWNSVSEVRMCVTAVNLGYDAHHKRDRIIEFDFGDGGDLQTER